MRVNIFGVNHGRMDTDGVLCISPKSNYLNNLKSQGHIGKAIVAFSISNYSVIFGATNTSEYLRSGERLYSYGNSDSNAWSVSVSEAKFEGVDIGLNTR